MAQTKEIIRTVLNNLKNSQKLITPENYFREFKIEAEKQNIVLEEFQKFEDLYKLLSENELKLNTEVNSFIDLAEIFSKRITKEELLKIIRLIDEIMVPSINFKIDESSKDKLFENFEEFPNNILEENNIKQIKELNATRQRSDRIILRQKTDDIVKLSTLLSKYFDKSILNSSNTNDELHKIRDELTELNISKASHRELGVVQKKLIDTIYDFENSMESSKKELIKNKEKFEQLNKTIIELQNKLDLAKVEKDTDYLTGQLNRRAYHEEVEKIEKKYELFKSNYAVVFFDIDHFKLINDTHGHTCGDGILKIFASILSELTRKDDILCRYGGEEFIALIHCDDEKEVFKYAKRVKEKIATTVLTYKDIKIKVKFSSGIAFRHKYSSYMETKRLADDLLYKAKEEGRDKIIFDNGTEI